jgi:RimJ/RimL family protein N-acetyltransferase
MTDLGPFHSICSDPDVMQFVGDGEPWSLDRTEQFIHRASEMSNGFCQWPLIHKESSTLIGFCGFIPAADGAEIGWRLAKGYWGQGLATEAAQAALRFGFNVVGFQRIIATVQSGNLPSIRVAQKLGMKVKTCFRRNERDLFLFAINKIR